MPEREADFLQVSVGQIAENAGIDVIFGKTLRILPEANCVEPVLNRPHCGPPTLDHRLYPILGWMASCVRSLGCPSTPHNGRAGSTQTYAHREALDSEPIAAAGAASPRSAQRYQPWLLKCPRDPYRKCRNHLSITSSVQASTVNGWCAQTSCRLGQIGFSLVQDSLRGCARIDTSRQVIDASRAR